MARGPFRFSQRQDPPRVRYFEVTARLKKEHRAAFRRESAKWRERFLRLYGFVLVTSTYAETGRIDVVRNVWRIPYWTVNNELMLDHAIGELAEEYQILDYTIEATFQNYSVGMPYDPGVLAQHASIYMRVPYRKGLSGKHERLLVRGPRDQRDLIIEIPVRSLYANRDWLSIGADDDSRHNRLAYEKMAAALELAPTWLPLEMGELAEKDWARPEEGWKPVNSKSTTVLLLNLSVFSDLSPFQIVNPFEKEPLATRESVERARNILAESKNKAPFLALYKHLMEPLDGFAGVCLAMPGDTNIFWLDRQELAYAHSRFEDLQQPLGATLRSFNGTPSLADASGALLEKGSRMVLEDWIASAAGGPAPASGGDRLRTGGLAAQLGDEFAERFVTHTLLPGRDISARLQSHPVHLIQREGWDNIPSYQKLNEILEPEMPHVGTVMREELGIMGVGTVCWAVDVARMAEEHEGVRPLIDKAWEGDAERAVDDLREHYSERPEKSSSSKEEAEKWNARAAKLEKALNAEKTALLGRISDAWDARTKQLKDSSGGG